MGSDERRRVILEAAARLFEHYGLGKTTMADVAREAGVGVGSLYLEFNSKEALVENLSLATNRRVLVAMRSAGGGEDDSAGRLKAVLIARTESFLEQRRKGQHACDMLHCGSGAVQLARERFKMEERLFFRELLEAGIKAGTFGDTDATRAALVIQHSLVSLSPPLLPDNEDDALRLTLELAELVLRGIVTRPSPDPTIRLFAKRKRAKAPSKP